MTTVYIGPIDLDVNENGGADVHRASGDLIARLRSISPHTRAVTDLEGTELGRVRWDGRQWDASAYLPAEDCYLLRGHHHSIEAAIIAVLRSQR
jgi:hypothetical protein